METKWPNPIHFSEMQRLMDTAYQRRQTLNIKAFRSDGNRVEFVDGSFITSTGEVDM